MNRDNYCLDCESNQSMHAVKWIDYVISATSSLLPNMPYFLENAFGLLSVNFAKILEGKLIEEYDLSRLDPRVRFFVRAARDKGVRCRALSLRGVNTSHVIAEYERNSYYLFAYPTAGFKDGKKAANVKSKSATKKLLIEGGFPVAKGCGYYFWQKNQAINDSVRCLGFPLVVKPDAGSLGKHVSLNVRTEEELREAVDHAVEYQPRFVIEQHVPSSSFRMTVIDKELIACARYVPPRVAGDGKSTVRELIKLKNEPVNAFSLASRIPTDKEFEARMEARGTDYLKVLPKGVRLNLPADPFLRIGAEAVDETADLHPENKLLFEKVAEYFQLHCAGIDVLMKDVSKPWHLQTCAIAEINNLPGIDMHYASNEDSSTKVAEALVHLFFKYYVARA